MSFLKFCALICSIPSIVVGALEVEISVIAEGAKDLDFFQARTALVGSETGHALTTMSQFQSQGSHNYRDVFVSYSEDNGKSWASPEAIPALRRKDTGDGYEVVAGDLWPKWHAESGTVLITGKTFNFRGGKSEDIFREKVAYAVFDPATRGYSPLQTLDMPGKDHSGAVITAPNAGCHQRIDLPGGEILLPVRYQRDPKKNHYTTIVARCGFDGSTLKYIEHGSEHTIPGGRGLYEPSAIAFNGEFFLTMRANDAAFVTKSKDGLRYDAHIPWTFDDGKPLGSYNTQQHWVVIGGKLHLIYTRKGANNDHIFRHRAPLFIAQVDPETLTVIRKSEQVLVPENHAILGNSGVCEIDENEIWVTVAEGHLDLGKRSGENNKVFLAKIRFAP